MMAAEASIRLYFAGDGPSTYLIGPVKREAMDSDGETSDGGQRLHRASDVLGKKWHPVLIYTLLRHAPVGFNALKSHVDGISDKVLSDSLGDLEAAGLVDRAVVDDKPVRVEYSLTDTGAALEPVIDELRVWCRDHADDR